MREKTGYAFEIAFGPLNCTSHKIERPQQKPPEESMSGPLHSYRALVQNGSITSDPGQAMALEKLQLLWNRLSSLKPAGETRSRGLFGFGRKQAQAEPALNGLYLYGGVGIGKSMMMDMFYSDAPIEPKKRIHFHDFMQQVHAALRVQRSKGTEDPLRIVAADIASETRLLCFDEMQVTDIADAIILGRLFQGLFDANVVIVATSNRHPKDLYKNGLNRHLFVPFIEMIEEKLDILHVTGPPDYRKADAARGGVYFAPNTDETRTAFDALWRSFCGEATPFPAMLNLQGRFIELPLATKTAMRAGFRDLCAKPLGAADYLLIAKSYRTVFLEGVPVLSPERRDQAKRFVTLVDALYEAKSRLVMLADAEPEDLYIKGDGAFEFERTASRLTEMRSERYLGALQELERI